MDHLQKSWCNLRVDNSFLTEIQIYINRRPTQTKHFCPGDLPGQNTHAFQADKQMASRVRGTAGFASAGRGGKSLCPSASVE
jgi:hypothetical protein